MPAMQLPAAVSHWVPCMLLQCSIVQVPATSVLERFLDAEDLVLGRCRDQGMAPDAWKEERERHWRRWGK
jgi:hypothetical protein